MGAYALAFVAGVLSFSSPCCLPLMPGYVSFVSGVASGSVGSVAVKTRVLAAASLFVVGFTLVFTLMGVLATAVGGLVLRNRAQITVWAGVFVIAMGLVTMGAIRVPALQRERRLALHRLAPGPAGALPLGMAFAIGWTPCIGPVLAGILTAAASTASVGRGASLLVVYSLGLGLPFLVLAIGVSRSGRFSSWLRRHGRGVELAGGALLVLMGLLMISGLWLALFTPILRIFSGSGWPPI